MIARIAASAISKLPRQESTCPETPMPHDAWIGLMTFITDAADEAVLLPTGLAVALVLVAMGWRRGAIVWSAVVAGGLAVIVALKIATSACASLAMQAGLLSPSGHTAASAMIAGGLVGLLMRPTRRNRAIAAVAAMLTALVIGVTRVGLGVHTVTDVIVAAPFGVLAAALISTLAAAPPPRFNPAPLLAVAVVVAICFHGLHLHAETIIRNFGANLGCPA
jgi:membrane-associated phospholipid phosphatase